MTTSLIRSTRFEDLPALADVVAATALFPPDMLENMAAPALSSQTSAIWLTCETGGKPVGFCYAAPEPMADRVWNMLALAVDPAVQAKGHGRALVTALETHLRSNGQRLLIVDTSGGPDFAATRRFYERTGYTQEASLRDYWEDGDDKVTFCKRL